MRRRFSGMAAVLALVVGAVAVRASDDFERDPIRYSTAAENNPASRLQQRLKDGSATLAYEKHFGYLRSLLTELRVPQSSQMLVFSKTSMQRSRICPQTPRAVYFGDDVYVGFCQAGSVLEVSAVDPNLGAVFYTLDQKAGGRPTLVRQNDACLLCHGSSQTRGVPGHLVRSVFPDQHGEPVLSSGSFRIDQTSPLARRWGGWYVTGTHGKQTHLGNLVLKDRREPEQVENLGGLNVTSLKGRIDPAAYLTPHSDIVALMVLEHQGEMHNQITRANFLGRLALHEEAALNRELGRSPEYHSETTYRRIKSAGDPLVKYLLFSGEATLTDPIQGTSGFAAEFVERGPRDLKGRSLRDLDLRTRLFKYPCSYLIYSPAFDALPGEVKDYVLRRVHDVLTDRDYSRDFENLSAGDRRAILEILRETKSDLPSYWREEGTADTPR
jgi:hypothetical protein